MSITRPKVTAYTCYINAYMLLSFSSLSGKEEAHPSQTCSTLSFVEFSPFLSLVIFREDVEKLSSFQLRFWISLSKEEKLNCLPLDMQYILHLVCQSCQILLRTSNKTRCSIIFQKAMLNDMTNHH